MAKALTVDILIVLGGVVLFPIFMGLGALLAVLERWIVIRDREGERDVELNV